MKEQKRLVAFGRVKTGDLTLVAASERLGLSYRQTKRAWARFQSVGDVGLTHRLRGRASNRKAQDELRQQVLDVLRVSPTQVITVSSNRANTNRSSYLFAAKIMEDHMPHRVYVNAARMSPSMDIGTIRV